MNLTYRKLIKKEKIDDSSCPLSFYKKYQCELPHMESIAKIVFVSLGTPISSECTFSDSGELIDQKKSTLTS
jgi:hypothetical protein